MATKKELITSILDTAGVTGTARQQARVKLSTMKVSELSGVLTDAKAQAAKPKAQPTAAKPKSKSKAQAKAQAARAQAAKAQAATSAKGTRKSKKIPKTLKSRNAKIARAIATGKVAAKQGIAKPSDYTTGTARQKNDRFAKLYAGTRAGRKKGTAKGPSVKAIYAQIKMSGNKKKWPYFLSAGYHVKAFSVGGGKKGSGIIRRIPGTSAPAFAALSDTDKARVVSFLNGPGKALRSKGAPTSVSLTAAKQQGKAAAS